LGLVSSHSRSHGAGDENGREAWCFGEEAVRIFGDFAQLRYRLLPYIIEQAERGAALGLLLIGISYLIHRNVWSVETQYLFLFCDLCLKR
jgi:alpha-D-xyloside xylohydrolase